MIEAPTITVRGIGRATMPPDRAVFTFSISATKKHYGDAIDELNARVDALRGMLAGVDIARDSLKTSDFKIDREISWHGFGDNKKPVVSGWKVKHALRLELPVDRNIINRALGAMADGDAESDLAISFEVSDREALRARVLENATRSATTDARIMAAAAGCTLGRPIRMSYDWSEVRVHTRKELFVGLKYDPKRTPDIEPEDVVGRDSVTVVFALET